jgi:hypothetical protein
MKSFSFLWFLMLPLYLEAQNWQNICSPGITLYKNPYNNFASFRLDSVNPCTGNQLDTIYHSYATLRKFSGSQYCFDTVFGSVLGKMVCRQGNGTFVFFNHMGDSVFLKTDAALLQSWKMISLPNSAYLLATVTEIRSDSVCGLSDLVKVITLQAKNAANQNIQHIFNNKQIVLSKNYGLTHIFDFVLFPSDTIPWTLIGKTTPSVGFQEFNIGDVYNFDVGDEFHSYEYHGNVLGFVLQETIDVILSKNTSITGDTIIYLTEKCIVVGGSDYTVTEKYHYTINDTIILHEHLFFSGFNNQPREFFPKPSHYCDLYQQSGSSFNNRELKRFYFEYSKYNPASTCWVYNNTYPYYEYSPGVGQTKYYYQYLANDPPVITTHVIELIYFRKGVETWGTPLAPTCVALLGVNEKSELGIPKIFISPNPVLSQSEFKLTGLKPGESAEIILLDCAGREVYRNILDSNPFIFKRENVPNGLYILKVEGIIRKFVITSKVILY